MPPIDIAPVPGTDAPLAEPVLTGAPAAAPVEAQTTAPLVTQPPETAAPLVTDAPATEPPTTETPATEAPTTAAPGGTTPAPTTTLEPSYLEQFGKTTVAPGESQPPASVEPVKYELKLPEGVPVDQEKLTAYTGLLQERGIAPEVGQQLLDMHHESINQVATALAKHQWDAFGETRRGWRTEIMADEQLGGSGHQTTMQAVARVRDGFISRAPEGSPQRLADEKKFEEFLRVTGAGDHPAFIRLLHNVAAALDEPAAPAPGYTPPKDIGRPAGKQGTMYDHPTSHRQRT